MNLDLPQPYLLFLGDETEASFAKTAFGLRDWAPDRCVGECALPPATVTTGLPRLSPAEARARGARALVIGVTNRGGVLALTWMPLLLEALEAGTKSRASMRHMKRICLEVTTMRLSG